MTLYSGVVAAHVMANFIAFGVWFAWPLLPGETAPAHRGPERGSSAWSSPAPPRWRSWRGSTSPRAGIFGKVWALVPLVIMVGLLGMTGSYLVPGELRLADLAEVGESEQYAALERRVRRAVLAGAGLVVVATFLMVLKPGG